jgi:hypothetical protein
MRLGNVRVGDMVRAGAWHAIVIEKTGRQLVVKGVCNHSTRRLTGAEVDAHWRQAKVR